MKTFKLEVSVTVPDSVGLRELQSYVREALEAWGGQRHPSDHLFDLHGQVKVRTLNIQKD